MLVFITSVACVCTREGNDDNDAGEGEISASVLLAASAFKLDTTKAAVDLAELTKAPHPTGSPRQAAVTNYLEGRAQADGARIVRQPFTATMPNPAALTASGPVSTTVEKAGVNLWAINVTRPADQAAPCVVALASHYDTKDIPGLEYVGANDSASSTLALLQQANQVKGLVADTKDLPLVCDIVFVWFDAEEALLADWNDGLDSHPAKIQDNTYGSRHAASQLTACTYEGVAAKCLPADLGGKPLVALILMDMIGSPGLRLSMDANSSAKLVKSAIKGAEGLGKPEAYDRNPRSIEDDHVPFLAAGVSALDLIDFNNLDFWHKAGDDPANISFESIELASKIGLYVAIAAAAEPKVFLHASE